MPFFVLIHDILHNLTSTPTRTLIHTLLLYEFIHLFTLI